ALPDLNLPVLDAGHESIERAHRRAACDLALRVVDASVAGADESLGRLDTPDRAAEVGAASRNRDVLALRLRWLVRVSGADVNGSLKSYQGLLELSTEPVSQRAAARHVECAHGGARIAQAHTLLDVTLLRPPASGKRKRRQRPQRPRQRPRLRTIP